MKRFFGNESGVGGVEFALIAPLMSIILLGIVSSWSYYRDLGYMRDGVEAGAKYYLQGGSNDATSYSIASKAWAEKPENGKVTVTRMCTCVDTSVSCGGGTICSDGSVPQIQVAIVGTMTWSSGLSDMLYSQGMLLTQSETVRVR